METGELILLFFLLVLLMIAVLPYAGEWRCKPMKGAARVDAPGGFAELPRGLTRYRWSGLLRGPVAVCARRLTTPGQAWEGIAEGLAAQGIRVLTYDLYGRGYSDRPAGRQDAESFCGQLEELLENQGIGEDVTLIGYSMGGVSPPDLRRATRTVCVS